MPIYNEAQDSITKRNREKTAGILSVLTREQRGELFNRALLENNFLMLNELLAWEVEYFHDLSFFFYIALQHNLSVDVASILISHAVMLRAPVWGYQAIWNILRQNDLELARFLEDSSVRFNYIEKKLMMSIESSPPGFVRTNVIQALWFITSTAKIYDVEIVSNAVNDFYAFDKRVGEFITLAEKWALPLKATMLLKEEVDLAYLLFLENPFYMGHMQNLIERLKAFYHSLEPSRAKTALQNYFTKTSPSRDGFHMGLIKATAAIKENPRIQLESAKGQCFGYSFMISQAMWVDEFEIFVDRMKLLFEKPFETLKPRLEANRRQMLLRHEDAKKKGGVARFSKSELDYVELEGFLQNMALAQSPHFHPAFRVNYQDYLAIAPFVMSKKLEEQGGIVPIKNFNGLYDHTSLTVYFHTLRKAINASRFPPPYIVLQMSCLGHIITVSYDVRKGQWMVLDPNPENQPQFTRSDWRTATEVMYLLSSSHGSHEVRQIWTYVFAPTGQKNEIKKIFDRWENSTHFRNLHNPKRQQIFSAKRPLFYDVNCSLTFAMASGNIVLMKLVFNSRNINTRFGSGDTPLTWAVRFGHFTAVKFLLDSKADVNVLYVLEGSSYNILQLSAMGVTTNILILLLSLPHLKCTREQFQSIGNVMRMSKNANHLKILLSHAQGKMKEELLKLPEFFHMLIELVLHPERLAFLSQERIQEYILHWVTDEVALKKLLLAMHPDERYPFLQKFQKHIPSWLAANNMLGLTLKSLPLNRVSDFLELYASKSPQMSLLFLKLVQELNEKESDLLVECIARLPDLQQTISNGSRIESILNDLPDSLERTKFFENLIRILYRHAQSNEEVAQKIEVDYKDNLYVQEQLKLAHGKYTLRQDKLKSIAVPRASLFHHEGVTSQLRINQDATIIEIDKNSQVYSSS